MEIRIITTTEGLESIKQDWERIEKNYPNLTICATYRYNYTWWSVFKDSGVCSLWIVCVIHNSVIIGIAPFMLKQVTKRLVSYKQLMFLSMADTNDIIYDSSSDANGDTVYKMIFSRLDETKDVWDEINLTHISHKSELAHYLLKSKYNSNFTYLIENPYIDVQDCYVNGEINDNILPDKTKQYANRLKKLTDYELILTTENRIDEFAVIHLAEMHHLNQAGEQNRHSLFQDKLRYSFFRSLAEQGLIYSYILFDKLKSKTIIYNFGFIFNGIFHSVNTGFEPEYGKYAVGKVMYYEILKENLINQKWNILDAGSGRYQWKFEWTSRFYLMYRYNTTNQQSSKMKLSKRITKLAKAIRSGI